MRCSEAVQLLMFFSCSWLTAAQFSDTSCPVVATDFTEFRPDEAARIQAACDQSLPQFADQKAFCSSCMCASSVALGASVDRTGKVISDTNYSTIIASIPTNPLLAARLGLSNCGALTSQVLQDLVL